MNRFASLAAVTIAVTALAVTGCGGNGQGTGGGSPSSGSGASGGGGPGTGGAGGGGGTGTAGGTPGDKYAPWEGGSAYYKPWTNGPPSDPSFFPISVWLQDPSEAQAYAAIGVNQFIGLWQGPTAQQISDLGAASMPVLCDQNATALADKSNKILRGWTQQDEPDDAQPDGMGGYGPCIDPATIQMLYQQWTAADATRPVFLNFGQGAAYTDWIGRGSCTSQTTDYPKYIQGADILSFDIYPMNETDPPVAGDLTYVAKGVDNLRGWAQYKKPVWNWIECTGINGPANKPTPDDVRAEVWLAIIHGSMGIGYFVHQFAPTEDDHALLDEATMKSAVAAINARLTALAPALNTPPISNGVTVASTDATVPIDTLLKREGGKTYLFAVAAKNAPTTGKFHLERLPNAVGAKVLDESRTVAIHGGDFQDDFAAWGVHLYEID
jgi:hypothetical protein